MTAYDHILIQEHNNVSGEKTKTKKWMNKKVKQKHRKISKNKWIIIVCGDQVPDNNFIITLLILSKCLKYLVLTINLLLSANFRENLYKMILVNKDWYKIVHII